MTWPFRWLRLLGTPSVTASLFTLWVEQTQQGRPWRPAGSGVNVVIIGLPSTSANKPNAGRSLSQPPVVHYGLHSALISANSLWWSLPGLVISEGPPRRLCSTTGDASEALEVALRPDMSRIKSCQQKCRVVSKMHLYYWSRRGRGAFMALFLYWKRSVKWCSVLKNAKPKKKKSCLDAWINK